MRRGRLGRYILVGQTPVPEPDLLTWAQWFETADRKVALTDVPGGVVSTIFLGLDHNFSEHGPPILFETMLWMDADIECVRTPAWIAAETAHREMVQMCVDRAKPRSARQ